MITVLLVDDQPLVRAGLRLILSPEDGFSVVGECADGLTALAAAEALRPAVVIVDVRMPGMDGIETTRRLRQLPVKPPVLVLTTFDDDQNLSAALRHGAAGFVLKDAPADDLIRATRVVAQGGSWLDPSVTGRVLSAYRSGIAEEIVPSAKFSVLSQAEVEIVQLIGRGATNQEIASALSVSDAAVQQAIGQILSKLNLRDRAATIVFAFDNKLVQPTA